MKTAASEDGRNREQAADPYPGNLQGSRRQRLTPLKLSNRWLRLGACVSLAELEVADAAQEPIPLDLENVAVFLDKVVVTSRLCASPPILGSRHLRRLDVAKLSVDLMLEKMIVARSESRTGDKAVEEVT